MDIQKLKVVVVDSKYLGSAAYFDHEEQKIRAMGGELIQCDLGSADDIVREASDADVLLCCGNPPITKKVLDNYQGSLVIRYGIGVNSVDLAAATENGKIVYNSPGFCREELVMHASALTLACLRNIGFYHSEIQKGHWVKAQGPQPRRLSKLTVGLFGFGDSAQPMADVFGKGFHSKVIAYDPFMNEKKAAEHKVIPVNFETLLRESDVLSIHAPLTEETHHIFRKETFAKMKKDSILVNISRGQLVCEEDLIQALKQGRPAYAGLDVFETEPLPIDSPLRSLSNVVLSPHSGFYGKDAIENGHIIAANLMEEFAKGRIVSRNVANKAVLEKWSGYTLI